MVCGPPISVVLPRPVTSETRWSLACIWTSLRAPEGLPRPRRDRRICVYGTPNLDGANGRSLTAVEDPGSEDLFRTSAGDGVGCTTLMSELEAVEHRRRRKWVV